MSVSPDVAKKRPPEPNEFEVSLFGPGVGECVVVHLGQGDWMVVDSCLSGKLARSTERRKPVALEYLYELGVDVGSQVKLILVTHWHDDHIRGIGHLLSEASSAKFACSMALRSDEFFRLVASKAHIKHVHHTSGVDEFDEVLDVLNRRSSSNNDVGPDHFVTDGKVLYTSVDEGFCVQVSALSPSAQTIHDAMRNIGKLIPQNGEIIRSIPVVAPNDSSIVLHLEFGRTSILLGGDLEIGRDDRRGWRAILCSDNHISPSEAFKISHHGSENAHLENAWDQLLKENPLCLLTPYNRGKKPLPSEKDLKRIKMQTNRLYATVWPPHVSPKRRDKAVERTLKGFVKTRRAAHKDPGQIRIRVKAAEASELAVELFNGASRLN